MSIINRNNILSHWLQWGHTAVDSAVTTGFMLLIPYAQNEALAVKKYLMSFSNNPLNSIITLVNLSPDDKFTLVLFSKLSAATSMIVILRGILSVQECCSMVPHSTYQTTTNTCLFRNWIPCFEGRIWLIEEPYELN